MNTFYLVRHAHAHWTLDENRPLSTRGRQDARRVADVLQSHPINVIVSSPFARARQTIEPLATRLGLPIQTEFDLRERQLCHGPVDDFLGAVRATWEDPTFAHPGGETNAAAQQRGLALVQRLREAHTAGHIVLGTHGNLMALTLAGLDPTIDFAFWRSLTMPDVYLFNWSPAGEFSMHRLWQETEP